MTASGETPAEVVTSPSKVKSRRRADALVYETEKNLKEHGEKLDAELKAKIETQITAVKDALKGEDAAALTSASEALQQAWHEAATKLYQQAGPAPGAGPQAGPEAASEPKKKTGGDGAVDADFEVVN